MAPSAYEIGENDNSLGSVGYEIFPCSFADSNGDGTGDLGGIMSHLDYLKSLGVHYLWLTPIFPSPTYHGYDCTDYYSIAPSLGDLTSFDALVNSAHEKGFAILLDLVLNHTAKSHPWFSQSEQDYKAGNTGTDSKKDYYVWKGEANTSASTSSAYTYDSVTGAYYEENFSGGMPELNLANAQVVEEIHKIASFWLKDHDVDGFRLDAARYYYKDDVAKNVSFLNDFKTYCQSVKPSAYLIGEAWEDSPTQTGIAAYEASGLSFFNFPTALSNGYGPGAAVSFSRAWSNYPSNLASSQAKQLAASNESQLAYFVGNHDTDRWTKMIAAGKSNQEKLLEVCATLNLLTPGNPWMYYGEEIKMWGVRGGLNEGSTDAARRLAMVWGGKEKRCANPSNLDDSAVQVTLGALDALAQGDSYLNHERQVIAVRNRHNALFQKGTYADLALTNLEANKAYASSLMGLKITSDGHEYYLIHSKSDASLSVSLPEGKSLLEDIATSLLPSSVSGTTLNLAPYSSVLLG